MSKFFQDIKTKYINGTSFTRILYINISIFIVIKLISVIGFLYQIENIDYLIEHYLSLPSNTSDIIKKPWTLISYMFIHIDFFHLIFNMIWLHFGSKIFLQKFTSKQLISTYLLGGIFGGILYIISFNSFPAFSELVSKSSIIGASASVIAIFISISSHSPNYKISIPLFGVIQLKYLATTLILLDILSISPTNPGGHIAHLGGALFGFIYIILLKARIDLSVNFYEFLRIFTIKKKGKLKEDYKRNKRNDDFFRSEKAIKQKKIDTILEKISKSGYDSLSKEEKNTLFKESR